MISNKGSNVTHLKLKNRQLILQFLKSSGAQSRADIAQYTGLTPAAITILVNEMVEEGIVSEVGQREEADRRLGRRKILVDINYDYKYVIGINIESDSVSIGVSNIKGETKAFTSHSINKYLTPEEILRNISAECLKILWKANVMKNEVIGAGVGIVGRVDIKRGTSIHAYGIWKQETEIKSIIADSLGVPVVIDNNVRAMAVGELDYHTRDSLANLLFIKFSPGVGGAMIINNQLYYGNNHEACEIGHTKAVSGGDICKCGGHGCLETVASKKAVEKMLTPLFCREQTPNLYRLCFGDAGNISIETACEAAASGDIAVMEVMRKVIQHLSAAISDAVRLFDPGRVILYGKAFKYDFFLAELRKRINDNIMHEDIDNYIVLSELNHKCNYIGGVALALREFFYDRGGAQLQ